jgi:hypothetical protein
MSDSTGTPQAGGVNESNLRKQILMIQQDKTLPDSEKARRIQVCEFISLGTESIFCTPKLYNNFALFFFQWLQQLMSGSFGQKHCKTGPKAIPVFNEAGAIREEESAPMYHVLLFSDFLWRGQAVSPQNLKTG